MRIADNWVDYELINMDNGMKKERWGDYVLVRPDPQIIWNNNVDFGKYDALYRRSNKGGGSWEYKTKLKDNWQIKYKDLTFNIKPMGFKHTGIFPEQAVNWDWMMDMIKNEIKNTKREVKVLNLFAYTGGATVACLSAGATVCHVDSSKGMVAWARENVVSSGLQDRPVRYIVDDVIKFVQREIRRGNKYDAIVMDPPSYGRGANGEVWKFEENLPMLIEICMQVLSDNPLFFLINSYTTGTSSMVLENLLKMNMRKKYGKKADNGLFENGEVGLPMTDSDFILPCGIYSKWVKK